MRKCFLRNVRGQFYNCLGGATELLDVWKGDRPLLHLQFGNLTVTNFAERGPVPESMANVLLRALIDTAIFSGFTNLDDLRMAIRFNGGNCPV
ncbi:hypothetical protein Y032_0058g2938 [Ancylostoma ceylanicum]|uniref:Uncharacterized protein n=1 Tax=Ancylostoma ceylanicum TaxID=53326 RepID=A0A016U400_9BILA|nr:hypothetical protein Y032_0058g2938 [Ancylostoma ceylanicum]